MIPYNSDDSQDERSAATLAAALQQLTADWKPADGVPSEALFEARQALASSLLAGKSLPQIHAVPARVMAGPPPNPELSAALQDIATRAAATPLPRSVAVVRSALAASLTNPAGRPDWTRGAKITQSYGPFVDLQGVLHWVDLLLFTTSIQFTFAGSSAPFGVFPVHGFLVPPPSPSKLNLGAGSVWFLANLLSSALPAGDFTGFSVTGGTLNASAPMSFQNGVYVIPAGATLTATLTLAPTPAPVSSGNPGADAAAAVFTPPSKVTIKFRQTSAAFESVADAAAGAYGSTVKLSWNRKVPVAIQGQPLLVVPCDPSAPDFAFSEVHSTLFTPSGSGAITLAGWGLPLAATSIGSLPAAAGPGSGVIEFHKGALVTNALEPNAVRVLEGLLEISTGGLYILVTGKARPSRTIYQLWRQAVPSKLNSTVEFDTSPTFMFAFLSGPQQELLFSVGVVTAHLDRPVMATGARFPYQGGALLLLDQMKNVTRLFLTGFRPDVPEPIVPLTLENAMLGVDAPVMLVLAGTVEGDVAGQCAVGLYFNLRWLLPTLPDPYAANFDLSVIRGEAEQTTVGTLLAVIGWGGGSAQPSLGFLLLPPPQGASVARTPFPATLSYNSDVLMAARRVAATNPALLDLSTRVDLFGVALFPTVGQLASLAGQKDVPADMAAPAPPLALTGMSLALNGALAVTFALPQVSWEPMESTAVDQLGPIYCEPASDGLPLLLSAPNNQQLVPFSPGPVLTNNIENVAAGLPFAAMFSLPFGLSAVVAQPNYKVTGQGTNPRSSFEAAGGQFRTNMPQFPDSFVPNPSPAPPELRGAVQLTVMPPHPDRPDAAFAGFTEVDTLHGPRVGPSPNGYGYTVIGASSHVGEIFENEFGYHHKTSSVPLRRIDFSGYGVSIFSEWNKPDQIPPAIIKIQFETSIGRTAFEVIKAASMIYPYCVKVVRTVTMQRQNAGWVKRTDTGWQAASQGEFRFPADTAPQWANAVHPGALAGVYNVRNIRDQAEVIQIPSSPFQFQKVLFDADLGISPSLKVRQGGYHAPVAGMPNPPVLVAGKDMIGYVQIAPDLQSPDPNSMRALFTRTGPFRPAIGCTVEAGNAGGLPGITMRCSAFEVDIITESNTGAPTPALGVALRGAPQIPRGGGWSLGERKFNEAAPAALFNEFPVPLVQPAGVADFWYLADTTDILQLTQPNNFYSLLHSTGTNKVLFESPQVPTAAAVPGLQFPKPNPPGPPKPGAVPINSGSPNLGDIASILNSTGLFPDIANAISMLTGAMEQINTITQGFHYSKSYTFDPNQKVTLIDLGVINIALQYGDITAPATPAAKLVYSVDSSASPSWSLSVGTVSFLVTVPVFGNSPLLTITGGLYADEHTSAGLTNLNVQMGDALSVVKNVFSDLQALAQFLPGGAGANLDVALSNGKLTVRDSFTIGDMPLGLGQLTDVSLDLGLSVQLQPLSVDFAVGIGNPGNPFNWIVSPLAGNGLMEFGVRANQPALTIQAGIGLGLAIDLGIASGSASVTIAMQLNVMGNSITLMAILSGQASVDVLDGLASASLTLSAALGFKLKPLIPPVVFDPAPPAIPTKVTLGPEEITLLASCSVGIHISICWVVSISWDGSWQFSQSVTTPQLTVGV